LINAGDADWPLSMISTTTLATNTPIISWARVNSIGMAQLSRGSVWSSALGIIAQNICSDRCFSEQFDHNCSRRSKGRDAALGAGSGWQLLMHVGNKPCCGHG